MPKVLISGEEWYPVFEAQHIEETEQQYYNMIEVSDEFMKKYRRVFKAFEKLQSELSEMNRA